MALALLLAAWGALTALDVWLRPRTYGRLTLSLVLIGLVIAALVWLARVVGRKRSPAAVAAFLEKKFPQLDNHLINRVLFANERSQSSWLRTYLNEDVPEFHTPPCTRSGIGACANAARSPNRSGAAAGHTGVRARQCVDGSHATRAESFSKFRRRPLQRSSP